MKKVVLPDLGEGIEKATISYWYANEGEHVEEGDNLVEVATENSVINIPAPCSGIVSEIYYGEGEVARVGEVICVIREETEDLDLGLEFEE